MDNIIVLSQNVKLASLSKLAEWVKPNGDTLIISTQLIFNNEAELIDRELGRKCSYLNFSDLITDGESEQCDVDALKLLNPNQDVHEYFDLIRRMKNEKVIENLLKEYDADNKILLSDDLGIDADVWQNAGFTKKQVEYYYDWGSLQDSVTTSQHKESKLKKMTKKFFTTLKNIYNAEIFVAHDEGKKYLFFGKMHRIGYRFRVNFKEASIFEKVRYLLDKRGFNTQPKTIRLSTIHEGYRRLPDRQELNYRLIQDGYLPPNYGSNYLYFYGKHTTYYAWDVEGLRMYKRFNVPCSLLPLRKNLYMPQPLFPKEVKNILYIASGAGDWTAIKNRSDDDKIVVAFGKLAELFPNINFVYRCHPVWISPEYQGVNSINRVSEYFDSLHLDNIKLSHNVPKSVNDGRHSVSFKRSSLEEDLKNADLVFGEHSISMIDAALKGILFCSVNLSGHRDLFCGMTEMGFPHCESLDELVAFIKSVGTKQMCDKYLSAVDKYNEMTDLEQ